MADVVIPEDVFDSIRLPDGEKDEALRLELAVSLYRRGALGFGKARELAGMSKEEFHSVLGDREVEIILDILLMAHKKFMVTAHKRIIR